MLSFPGIVRSLFGLVFACVFAIEILPASEEWFWSRTGVLNPLQLAKRWSAASWSVGYFLYSVPRSMSGLCGGTWFFVYLMSMTDVN